MVRELLKFYLQSGGYQNLLFAGDGDEALDVITTEEPDLVVLDLQMPRMGGPEVCQTLRADPSFRCSRCLSRRLPIPQRTGPKFSGPAQPTWSASRSMTPNYWSVSVFICRTATCCASFPHYRESMERDLKASNEKYGIEIRSHFETCDALGGDMWNAWPIDENRMGFHIIDFTGHGVVASLNTFRFQSLVAATRFDGNDQEAYIAKISRRLHSMLPTGQFATAIGGYIDMRENVMRYIAAAGPKPFLISPETPDGMFLPSDGRPLGMTADSQYEEREVAFPPGSSLFMYSDALTGAPDMVNPVYDEDRKQLALTGGLDEAGHPFDVIHADFCDRVEGPLDDDQTMVMLSRPTQGED